MYLKFDKSSDYHEEMINNERPGSFNVMVLLLWLTAAAIVPYECEVVYNTLIGGNHVMHFRLSYWKKLVRGAIMIFICTLLQTFSIYNFFTKEII